MKRETSFAIIRAAAWILSAFSMVAGLVFLREPAISPFSQIYASLMVEAGGAFFFALTVGWTLDKMQSAEGYSVLWLFSQEFRKAGVLGFYSDRKGYAEESLEQAFEQHSGGEVIMVGASLRLFLAPGLHFYSYVEKMMERKGRRPISVRAMYCHPEKNYELPVRSFVEEFNQDGSFPKDSPYRWGEEKKISIEEFESVFFQKYGIGAPSQQRVRVIHDLESTRAGVKALQGVAKGAGNHIYNREFIFAPYCTIIIFPEKAFYTPNLLNPIVPVNMPMIVFHKTADAYEKLLAYAEFLWWISEKE